jgi:hypothetical protein
MALLPNEHPSSPTYRPIYTQLLIHMHRDKSRVMSKAGNGREINSAVTWDGIHLIKQFAVLCTRENIVNFIFSINKYIC